MKRFRNRNHFSQTDETDPLDHLARQWHQDVQASDLLTAKVQEAIRPRSASAAPRYLVPALTIACLLLLLGGGIGLSTLRPPSAFAAVQQAMRVVKTARWTTETVTRSLPDGTVLQKEQSSTLIDLDRLAARVTTGSSEVYVRTRTEGYWKRNGKITPDTRPVTEAEIASDLRRRLFPDVRTEGRKDEWRVTKEVRDGKLVRHFVLVPPANAPTPDTGMAEEEFWADGSTNLIVATRYRVTRREGKRLVEDTFTTGDYEYDLTIPETTFQLR